MIALLDIIQMVLVFRAHFVLVLVLTYSFESGSSDCLYLNLKANTTALICAVEIGNAEVVKVLLQERCDLEVKDADGWTALIHAVKLGNKDIALWLYLLPFSALLTGIYQSLTYWNNRQKKFKNIATSRVNQSLTQGLTQTLFGFSKMSGGLIIGQILGIASSVIFLLKKDNTYKKIKNIKNKETIIEKMLEYKKFPQYSIFGSLCDAAAAQMPVFILTRFYSYTITGMFSLTFRVLNIPATIISAAVGQVLFQKIVEISHTAPEKLNKYIIKTFIILLLTYLPVIPILFIWGDDLFSFVFGEKWREAGVYAGYLVIAVAIRFAVSPLSTVMGLEKNVKTGVFWQILYFCTIIPTLYFSSSLPIQEFFIIFTIHEVILYFVYLTLIIKSSRTAT